MFPKSFSWVAKLVLGVAVLSWSALPGEAGKGGGGGGGRGGGGGGGRSMGSGHSSGGHHNHGGNFGYWPGFGYGYYYPGYGYYTQPIFRSSYYQPNTEDDPDAGEPASITLKVPADAEVWFNNTKTKQKGKVREFLSPPLVSGYSYQYQIRALWLENGKTVNQTRDITIRPGESIMVEIRGPAPAQP